MNVGSHRNLRLSDADVLSAAAALLNSRRKVHAGGRPPKISKCPKCGAKHSARDMRKCKGESK